MNLDKNPSYNLSMVGIAGEINVMAWMYAKMLEQFIQLIMKLGYMYAYDAAYVIKEDSASSAGDVTNAISFMVGISEAVVSSAIEETAKHLNTVEENLAKN